MAGRKKTARETMEDIAKALPAPGPMKTKEATKAMEECLEKTAVATVPEPVRVAVWETVKAFPDKGPLETDERIPEETRKELRFHREETIKELLRALLANDTKEQETIKALLRALLANDTDD